jgi:hypothetical protein
MNIETNDNIARGDHDYLIDAIAQAVGDIGGVNIDGNCSIGDMANLLTEIENAYSGDLAIALEAIRAGDLRFEEIHYPDGAYSAWHIKATRH